MPKSLQDRLKDNYEQWEYSPEGIHYSFGGSHGILQEHEAVFFKAISKLPKNIIDFTQNIFFTSHRPDDFGECFLLHGKTSKKYIAIVHLYSSLWKKPLRKIVETIAHEIAHAYLKHEWNDITRNGEQEEIQADKLASKWVGHKINSYKRYDCRRSQRVN